MDVKRVAHKQYYDLVFRAKNARLRSAAYSLDYLDWLKAGVAFNTRGIDTASRKIDYFAQLYRVIARYNEEGPEVIERNLEDLASSFPIFYEDIFEIYQYHLESKQREVKYSRTSKALTLEELFVVPTFERVPFLRDYFTTETRPWLGYQSEVEEKFLLTVNSPYLDSSSGLYSCMSLLFDYGTYRSGKGVLLEIDLRSPVDFSE